MPLTVEWSFSSAPFVGSDFPSEAFTELRELLLQRRRFDLGMYKDPCIKRRIAKRVRALGLHDIRSYLQVLEREPAEIDALLATLSIHVSQFFRNPSTFAVLEGQVLPELIRRADTTGNSGLRIWSVGCAGGEEPYSLALLLEELPGGSRAAILGTDISGEVLARAREGLFDRARLAEVPEETISRYFIAEPGGWRLDAKIRQRVRFRQQDILSPTPYPAADLILCRNVMIYFSRIEQENILCRFAAALRPRGMLVLGKAETLVGEARRLFQSENAGERIYRRVDRSAAGSFFP